MAKRTPPVEAVSALDPHHPLIRRLTRRLQLVEREAVAGTDPLCREQLLVHVGYVIADVSQHIAKARPRVEHDEAAQQLIAFEGQPIGHLRRPPTVPDLLHPALEAAINRQLDGDPCDGDHDQVAECSDLDLPASVLA